MANYYGEPYCYLTKKDIKSIDINNKNNELYSIYYDFNNIHLNLIQTELKNSLIKVMKLDKNYNNKNNNFEIKYYT